MNTDIICPKIVGFSITTSTVIIMYPFKSYRVLMYPVDEGGNKMDDGVDTSVTSQGICLFVDLWDSQPCLWDPQ